MHAKLREKLAQMNTYAQENISGNRVVKAFAREAYEIENLTGQTKIMHRRIKRPAWYG